jgi:hypothetical protein
MPNFYNNFENLTPRPGLYRVWVPLHSDGKAPLISIWIDHRMTAFEVQFPQESTEISEPSEGALSEEIEGPRCSAAAGIAFNVAA